MKRILSLLLSLTCLLPAVASARLIATPTYQDLYDRADVVVIATPQVGTTTDERLAALPGLQPDVPAVGVNTRLRVQAWLKGVPNATVVLHHYRLANPGQPLLNGPLLLDFDRADAPTLLLFLVREPDGRYAPIAGQTDPAGFSVFRIDRRL